MTALLFAISAFLSAMTVQALLGTYSWTLQALVLWRHGGEEQGLRYPTWRVTGLLCLALLGAGGAVLFFFVAVDAAVRGAGL